MTPGYKGRMYCSRRCAERSAADMKKLRQKRNCVQCGKRYRAGGKHQKFCSQECRDESYRKYQTRSCTTCGKPFYPKRPDQHLCSKACNPVLHRRTVKERPCRNCGAMFRPKRRTRKYCCHPCAARQNRVWKTNLRAGTAMRLTAPRFDALFGQVAVKAPQRYAGRCSSGSASPVRWP